MQKTIKAIPTEYDGTTYRSILEAKWALFFDLINVRFAYEPSEWCIEEGTVYVPDFIIYYGIRSHQSDATKHPFIEIKPIAPSSNFLKKVLNTRDVLKSDLFICVGDPSMFQPNGIWITTNYRTKSNIIREGFIFHHCPYCGIYSPDELYNGIPFHDSSYCSCRMFAKPKEWVEAAAYVKYHRFDI